MLPKHPQRLCQCPKTARLAQMMLAVPVLPINISKNPDTAASELSFSATPYNIVGSGAPIPDKIYRDMQINCSHSVSDWLLAASRDQALDEIDRDMFADFRNRLIEIAAAGINDAPIDVNMQGRLMAACHKIVQKKDVHDWQKVIILGVKAPEALTSIRQYATEISNRLIREQTEINQGMGDRGNNG